MASPGLCPQAAFNHIPKDREARGLWGSSGREWGELDLSQLPPLWPWARIKGEHQALERLRGGPFPAGGRW